MQARKEQRIHEVHTLDQKGSKRRLKGRHDSHKIIYKISSKVTLGALYGEKNNYQANKWKA